MISWIRCCLTPEWFGVLYLAIIGALIYFLVG